MKINYQAGFTLIELLVVILIIGILAAVALPQYQKAVEKSRATEGIVLARAIANANETYRLANGDYAESLEDLDIDIPGRIDTTSNIDSIITPWFSCRARNDAKLWKYSALCRRIGKGYYIGYRISDKRFICGSNETDLPEGVEWCKFLTGQTTPISGTSRIYAFD